MATEADKERYAPHQIRRGYRAIPQDLLDNYMPILEHECRGSYLVFQYIYRQTFGFYEKSKVLSARTIATGIGWPVATVINRLHRLLEWGFLQREPRKIRIGKNGLEAQTYELRINDKMRKHIFRPTGLEAAEDPDERLGLYWPPEFQRWLDARQAKK